VSGDRRLHADRSRVQTSIAHFQKFISIWRAFRSEPKCGSAICIPLLLSDFRWRSPLMPYGSSLTPLRGKCRLGLLPSCLLKRGNVSIADRRHFRFALNSDQIADIARGRQTRTLLIRSTLGFFCHVNEGAELWRQRSPPWIVEKQTVIALPSDWRSTGAQQWHMTCAAV
jgi:hypothetical protein